EASMQAMSWVLSPISASATTAKDASNAVGDRDTDAPVGRRLEPAPEQLQLALERLEALHQEVALGGERGELPLAQRISVVLLGELRLDLRLPPVERLQLLLEPAHLVLGGQVPHEEDVEEECREQHARRDEHPGERRARAIGHGLGF